MDPRDSRHLLDDSCAKRFPEAEATVVNDWVRILVILLPRPPRRGRLPPLRQLADAYRPLVTEVFSPWAQQVRDGWSVCVLIARSADERDMLVSSWLLAAQASEERRARGDWQDPGATVAGWLAVLPFLGPAREEGRVLDVEPPPARASARPLDPPAPPRPKPGGPPRHARWDKRRKK